MAKLTWHERRRFIDATPDPDCRDLACPVADRGLSCAPGQETIFTGAVDHPAGHEPDRGIVLCREPGHGPGGRSAAPKRLALYPSARSNTDLRPHGLDAAIIHPDRFQPPRRQPRSVPGQFAHFRVRPGPLPALFARSLPAPRFSPRAALLP